MIKLENEKYLEEYKLLISAKETKRCFKEKNTLMNINYILEHWNEGVKDNLNVSGIYMIYVQNSKSGKSLPIYIGVTKNLQKRFIEHIKAVVKALYNLKVEYEFKVPSTKYYRIANYLVSNNLDHKSKLYFKVLEKYEEIIPEIDSDEIYLKKEQDYMFRFGSHLYGFNYELTYDKKIKPKDIEQKNNFNRIEDILNKI